MYSQMLVPRPYTGPGNKVYWRGDGAEVCRGSYPGPGGDVGGEHQADPSHLLPVHGLRPHHQHRGPGQEAKAEVQRHIDGSGARGACKKASAAVHDKCEWEGWEEGEEGEERGGGRRTGRGREGKGVKGNEWEREKEGKREGEGKGERGREGGRGSVEGGGRDGRGGGSEREGRREEYE